MPGIIVSARIVANAKIVAIIFFIIFLRNLFYFFLSFLTTFMIITVSTMKVITSSMRIIADRLWCVSIEPATALDEASIASAAGLAGQMTATSVKISIIKSTAKIIIASFIVIPPFKDLTYLYDEGSKKANEYLVGS